MTEPASTAGGPTVSRRAVVTDGEQLEAWLEIDDLEQATAQRPPWLCPVAGTLLWWAQGDAIRARVTVDGLASSATDGLASDRLARIADFLLRTWLPAIIYPAGLDLAAAELRELPELTAKSFPGSEWARALDHATRQTMDLPLDRQANRPEIFSLDDDVLADHPAYTIVACAWRTLRTPWPASVLDPDDERAVTAEIAAIVYPWLTERCLTLAVRAVQSTVGKPFRTDWLSLESWLSRKAAATIRDVCTISSSPSASR